MINNIDTSLGQKESEFADIVWENEPLKSSELVRLCAEKLDWKRTTTYTVLKKLCEKGIFSMENSIVKALLSRDEFYAAKSKRIVDDSFNGSLAAFVSAFAASKKMSEEEIDELKKLIDEF